MLPVKADLVILSVVCLDSAIVWLSCYAIKWISVLATLCRVLANPVTYGKIVFTGAVYISQLLNVTHTLQELDMGSNDIGDDGMAVISESLLHNKSLTELNVSWCGLSVKGTVVCKM